LENTTLPLHDHWGSNLPFKLLVDGTTSSKRVGNYNGLATLFASDESNALVAFALLCVLFLLVLSQVIVVILQLDLKL
jgi:hypothetical protein